MTSIDERIKQELEEQSGVLDELFPETAIRAFKGKLKMAVICVAVFGFMLLFTVIWCITELIAAETVLEAIRWGVWVLLSSLIAILVELWAWIQIGRVATRREIQQMEANILRAIDSGE
jgi:hypothetical protein